MASTNLTNLSNYNHELELKNKEAAKMRLIIAEQLRKNKKKVSALDEVVDAQPYGSVTSLEPLVDSKFHSRNSVFAKQHTVNPTPSINESKPSHQLTKRYFQKPLGPINITDGSKRYEAIPNTSSKMQAP